MSDRYDVVLSRRTRSPLQIYPAGSVPAFVAGHPSNEVVRLIREPRPMEAVIVPRMALEAVAMKSDRSKFELDASLSIVEACLVLPE